MAKELLACGELIKRICDIFEAKVNREMQEQDITLSQMKVLVYLDSTHDGSAMLKELERYFGTSQATIAGIVVRLEKKGLLEGYTDAQDRRIKHAQLSENGRRLCRHMKSQMEEGEKWLLRSLESTEAHELQRLLQKVYDSLQ